MPDVGCSLDSHNNWQIAILCGVSRIPESFKVLVRELQSLGLSIDLRKKEDVLKEIEKAKEKVKEAVESK